MYTTGKLYRSNSSYKNNNECVLFHPLSKTHATYKYLAGSAVGLIREPTVYSSIAELKNAVSTGELTKEEIVDFVGTFDVYKNVYINNFDNFDAQTPHGFNSDGQYPVDSEEKCIQKARLYGTNFSYNNSNETIKCQLYPQLDQIVFDNTYKDHVGSAVGIIRIPPV